MYYGKRRLRISWLATVLTGVLLHFLYDLLPCWWMAFFAPVNESIWEHTKVIFWPYLAAALLLNRGRPGGIRPWLLTLPLICVGMLALGYGYHVCLAGDQLWVDIAIYLLAMTVGFVLPPRFSGSFDGPGWKLPGVMTVLLGAAIFWFTLYPPERVLFADLSAVRTWLTIPF